MAVRAEPGLPLSDREAQVAGLVARGLADKQIAAELRVSERTVHAHLRHAYAKTGSRNRAALVNWLASHPFDGEANVPSRERV